MPVKDFLQPEWKKFVLPFFFIVMLFVFIYVNYLESWVRSDSCELLELEITIRDADNITDVDSEILKRYDAIAYNSEKYGTYLIIGNIVKPFLFPLLLNYPILPLKCTRYRSAACSIGFLGLFTVYEGLCSDPAFCVTYMTEENFECEKLRQSIPESGEYRELAYVHIVLNVVVLLIEWYLISCAALHIYRKKLKGIMSKEITISKDN